MCSMQALAALEPLRQRIRLLEQTNIQRGRADAALRLGIPSMDDRLPPRSGLHEILADSAAGLGFVATILAAQANDMAVLWCRVGWGLAMPHARGLAALGLEPQRLIIVRARRPADALWAMEEGLRCQRLAAVLGEGVEPSGTASRRLQLAAETGATPAFLLLTPTAQPPPSVALTRWRISPLPTPSMDRPRWRVALMRCRGGGLGEWVLEWDDEALRLDLVAELADRSLAAAE